MKKSLLSISFFGIGFLGIIGCYPASWTVTPQITGRVETADHKPVGNATVTVDQVFDHVGKRGGSFQMTTDANGSFYRAEQTQWVVVPLVPIDALVPIYSAAARADGRETRPIKFGGGDMTGPHFLGLGNAYRSYDLGTLVLENPPPTTTEASK